MRRISKKVWVSPHGGHRAAHSDAAGTAQGGHGCHGLGLGSLLPAEKLDGFCHPGVGVLGQKDPAGRPVFQGTGDLLGPRHLFGRLQIGQHRAVSPLSRPSRTGPMLPIPTDFARQK